MRPRYIIATLAAMVAVLASAASQAVPDTVMSVSNPRSVMITETSGGVSVTVNGTAEDPDFRATFTEQYPDGSVVRTSQSFTEPYTSYRLTHSDWTVNMGGLMFGMVAAPGAPADMGVEMAKSYEIGIAEALSLAYRTQNDTHSVMAGIGFTWRNYRTTLGCRYMSTPDGRGVVVEPWPADVQGRFARLKIFSLTFPILYEYRFPFNIPGASNRFALKGGVILNWNSHGSVKSAWIDADGRDVTYTSNSIGQRRFTVDFMLAVKPMPIVGLYCKYSPTDVLDAGHGPSFRSLSAGLIFMF